MMTYAIIGIVILGLVASIVRNYNLPKTLEARKEVIEANAKKADERREDALKAKAAREAAREARRRKRP